MLAQHMPARLHAHTRHASAEQVLPRGRSCCVVVWAGQAKKRNPIKDIERDLLPDGKPNTPWRRIKLKIQSTVSVQGLMHVYNRNRHKTSVWRPIHSAGILMRLGALHYFRLLPQQRPADEQTSDLALQLLDLMAPDLADQRVTSVMDGSRLSQLIVVLSRLNPAPPTHLLDPLIRELLRNKGNKLPQHTPDLLAELAAALARLGWREQQLWLALAAAATAALQQQAYNRQQQQPQQQQWQQPVSYKEPPWLQEPSAGDLLTPPCFDDEPPVSFNDGPPSYNTLPKAAAAAAAAAVPGSLDSSMGHWEVAQPAAAAAAAAPQTAARAAAAGIALPIQQQQQQQQRQQCGQWLSGDYPKLAAALAAVGHEDLPLMLLLGTEAVQILPLLSLRELAQLGEAYAAFALPHKTLLPALWQQLLLTAKRSSSGSSGSSSNKQQAVDRAGGIVRALYPLMQLSGGEVGQRQRNRAAQQQQELLKVVQDLVMQSGSSGGAGGAALPARTLVQLLELTAAAGAVQAKWQGSSLARWTCNAVAAAGLESLQPHELQAAAAALGELQPSPGSSAAATAAAAALAAAAVARAEECGPGVMAGVLWGCVTVGCYDMLLADVTVSVLLQGLEPYALGWSAPLPRQQLLRQQGQPQAMVPLLQQEQQWQHQLGSQRQQQQQQQQQGLFGDAVEGPAVLSATQQAQLVWALQQMGRQDLAQQVMNACLAPA